MKWVGILILAVFCEGQTLWQDAANIQTLLNAPAPGGAQTQVASSDDFSFTMAAPSDLNVLGLATSRQGPSGQTQSNFNSAPAPMQNSQPQAFVQQAYAAPQIQQQNFALPQQNYAPPAQQNYGMPQQIMQPPQQILQQPQQMMQQSQAQQPPQTQNYAPQQGQQMPLMQNFGQQQQQPAAQPAFGMDMSLAQAPPSASYGPAEMIAPVNIDRIQSLALPPIPSSGDEHRMDESAQIAVFIQGLRGSNSSPPAAAFDPYGTAASYGQVAPMAAPVPQMNWAPPMQYGGGGAPNAGYAQPPQVGYGPPGAPAPVNSFLQPEQPSRWANYFSSDNDSIRARNDR